MEIDWTEHYPYAFAEKPLNQPEAIAIKAQTTLFIDADHAHDQVMQQYVSLSLLTILQSNGSVIRAREFSYPHSMGCIK